MDGTPLGLLVVLGFIALAAARHYSMKKQGARRPLWVAFGATAATIFFVGAGLAGYNISKYSRSMTGTAWSETMIWWEVAVGLVAATIATVSWRRGLKSI